MVLTGDDLNYFLDSVKQAYEDLPLTSRKYVEGIEAAGGSINLLEPNAELNDFDGTIIPAPDKEEVEHLTRKGKIYTPEEAQRLKEITDGQKVKKEFWNKVNQMFKEKTGSTLIDKKINLYLTYGGDAEGKKEEGYKNPRAVDHLHLLEKKLVIKLGTSDTGKATITLMDSSRNVVKEWHGVESIRGMANVAASQYPKDLKPKWIRRVGETLEKEGVIDSIDPKDIELIEKAKSPFRSKEIDPEEAKAFLGKYENYGKEPPPTTARAVHTPPTSPSPSSHAKKKPISRKLIIGAIVAGFIIISMVVSAVLLHSNPTYESDNLVSDGVTLAKQGKYSDAIQNFNKALAIDPNNTGALDNKGYALGMLGNYPDSVTAYDKALAINPKDVYALGNKGNALIMLKNYQEAADVYDQAFTLDPSNVGALDNKGYALTELGHYKDALAVYDQALAINPNDTHALDNKGYALNKLGNYKDALAAENQALAINPNDNVAEQNKIFTVQSLNEGIPPTPSNDQTAESPMVQVNGGTCTVNQYCDIVIATASGGSPPYHFQSGIFANGAPPMGMTVGINGHLTGTPTRAGEYPVSVCVTDIAGKSSCTTATITVVEAGLTGKWTGTVSGTANLGLATCSFTGSISMNIVQSSNNIAGGLSVSNISVSGQNCNTSFENQSGMFSGTVSGSNLSGSVALPVSNLSINGQFDSNSIQGTIGGGNEAFTLNGDFTLSRAG